MAALLTLLKSFMSKPLAKPFSIHVFSHNHLCLLTLILLGIAGNYFNFPLFFNVDFIFGTIFSMLILQFFGPAAALTAGVLIASYTYVLWNHPWVIIIATIEMAVVSLISSKRKVGLVAADFIFWIFLGIPLVYFFYHIVMGVPAPSTYIFMLKQSLNGVTNVLIARLIFAGFTLLNRATLISYKDFIYNALALFVLLPALVIISYNGRKEFSFVEAQVKSTLIRDSQRLTLRLSNWVNNRQNAINYLANLAQVKKPMQMQPHLEQSRKSDNNFLRIGLHNKDSVVVAHDPLLDDFGHTTLGKDFSDRAYIPIVKKITKSFLPEVVKSRIGKREPVVTTISPVISNGIYNGYVIGILSLKQLKEDFDRAASENTLIYSLVDRNGKIILSNGPGHSVMSKFKWDNGLILPDTDHRLARWVPILPSNTPMSEIWKKSFYVTQSSVGNMNEWKLVLEQPIAPFQKVLFDRYTQMLLILFLIFAVALLVAELFSKKIVFALEELNSLAVNLPDRLGRGDNQIKWPKTGFTEARQLINNFQNMAQSLALKFKEINHLNETLEKRVEERQKQLIMAQQLGHTGSWCYDIEKNSFWGSQQALQMLGFHEVASEVAIDMVYSCIPEKDRVSKTLNELITEGKDYNIEYTINPADGTSSKIVQSIAKIEKDEFDKPSKVIGFIQDITERYKSEAHARFLAEAGQILSESLETNVTLNKIASLVTTRIADGCIITLLKEDGSLALREVIHNDAEKEQLLLELVSSFEKKKYLPNDYRETLKAKKVILNHQYSIDLINDELISHEDKVKIKRLGRFSSALIPLTVKNKFIGMLRLISDSNENRFDQSDIIFFESIGHRIALSIENARLYEETKRAVKVREDILAIVSHDLRNPLSAILMNTQLLQKTAKDEPKINLFAPKILKSMDQMKRMIDDLMDFAKIQSGNLSVLKKLERPCHVVDIVNEMMKGQAEGKGLSYVSDVDCELPMIYCDKQRIAQALLNLMGNAIKFTENGSVKISVVQTDKGMQFSVTDTGPGISKIDLPKVFDRYWQAQKSQKASAGLGLSIVKGIIDAHQGQINVNSEVGKGSTFSFILPMP